jgi:hypothetical protein
MSEPQKMSTWAKLGLLFAVLGIAFLFLVDPPTAGIQKPADSPAQREEPLVAPMKAPPSAPVPTVAPTLIPSSTPSAKPTKAEAAALLAELRELVQIGAELASLRYDGNPSEATPEQLAGQRRCVGLMNANRPRIDGLVARATRMPDSYQALAGSLSGCLYCRPMADEGCKVARDLLREAERARP